VVELLGQLDRAGDRFDDDPLVVGAAERLAFDDLAGQPVADQPGSVFAGRAAAAHPQLHQLT
jgi:hypothetical protein